MAQLLSYRDKYENRYSTFFEKSSNSNYRKSTDLEGFENFNQFMLCEPKIKSSRVKVNSYNKKSWLNILCCFTLKKNKALSYSYDINMKISKLQDGRYNAGGTLKTEMGPPGKTTLYKEWLWNDSLRSDSDKFLETLEYDDLFITRSLKRMKKVVKVRPIGYRHMGGWFFSLTHVSYSFILGQNKNI